MGSTDQPERNERKTKVSKKSTTTAKTKDQKDHRKKERKREREKKRRGCNIKTSTRKKLKKTGTSPPTKPP